MAPARQPEPQAEPEPDRGAEEQAARVAALDAQLEELAARTAEIKASREQEAASDEAFVQARRSRTAAVTSRRQAKAACAWRAASPSATRAATAVARAESPSHTSVSSTAPARLNDSAISRSVGISEHRDAAVRAWRQGGTRALHELPDALSYCLLCRLHVDGGLACRTWHGCSLQVVPGISRRCTRLYQ